MSYPARPRSRENKTWTINVTNNVWPDGKRKRRYLHITGSVISFNTPFLYRFGTIFLQCTKCVPQYPTLLAAVRRIILKFVNQSSSLKSSRTSKVPDVSEPKAAVTLFQASCKRPSTDTVRRVFLSRLTLAISKRLSAEMFEACMKLLRACLWRVRRCHRVCCEDQCDLKGQSNVPWRNRYQSQDHGKPRRTSRAVIIDAPPIVSLYECLSLRRKFRAMIKRALLGTATVVNTASRTLRLLWRALSGRLFLSGMWICACTCAWMDDCTYVITLGARIWVSAQRAVCVYPRITRNEYPRKNFVTF